MKSYHNNQLQIKKSNIASLILALFILVPFFAQAQINNKQLSLELNGSAGFLPNSSTIFIPQIGLDYYSGLLGIRVNGQFFKNFTAFSFDNYLTPLQPIFTTEVKKESNTNIVLGITPYLNFNSGPIGIQPGISFQYLIQNSASAQAYYQYQENTVLKFPNEDKTQKLFLITPNVKLLVNIFNGFTFFLQTGYVIPKGQNEISYTMRDYKTNSNGIDVKTVMNTPLVTRTEKILPEHFNIGIGLNISLWSTPKKALDAFISATTKAALSGGEDGPAEKTQFDVILKSGIKISVASEPVPGAEITVEQVPGPTIIKSICKTGENGEFDISISNIDEFQGKESSVCKFMVTIKTDNKSKFKAKETKIPLTLNKSEGPFYEFVVVYNKGEDKFFIEQVNEIIKSAGIKRQKGDASKTGDKYMGQVAHF